MEKKYLKALSALLTEHKKTSVTLDGNKTTNGYIPKIVLCEDTPGNIPIEMTVQSVRKRNGALQAVCKRLIDNSTVVVPLEDEIPGLALCSWEIFSAVYDMLPRHKDDTRDAEEWYIDWFVETERIFKQLITTRKTGEPRKSERVRLIKEAIRLMDENNFKEFVMRFELYDKKADIPRAAFGHDGWHPILSVRIPDPDTIEICTLAKGKARILIREFPLTSKAVDMAYLANTIIANITLLAKSDSPQ